MSGSSDPFLLFSSVLGPRWIAPTSFDAPARASFPGQ
jgi:hypothetical protein